MEKITDGKSRAKPTGAMIQANRLNIQFELYGKYGLKKGALAKVSRPVPGQTMIEKEPLPEGKDYTETDYRDFKAEEIVKLVGISYDWWSGKMFIEFIAGDTVLFYDWSLHGPGDTSFGEIFVKVADPTVNHGLTS